MSDHTNGPWALQGPTHSGAQISYVVITANGSYVVFISQIERNAEEPQFEANARLIAAAPEIQASLKEMREACAACFRVIFSVPGLADKLDKEFTRIGMVEGFGVRADEAIARVEGRS